MQMTPHRAAGAFAAAVILASIGLPALSAQTGSAPAPAQKVIVAGENPAITLRGQEGGEPLTSVNFWRVHWSPVGAGAVCFITVNAPGAENLRIALYDNPKVLQYVTSELMSSLSPTFNTPPFTPHAGKITQSGDMVNERKETCASERYTVELTWRGFSEARWIDIKPGAETSMTFAMVMATGADVVINGRKAPGNVFRGGPGAFPPSFLAVNETWRR
jgi:hypothetical protein